MSITFAPEFQPATDVVGYHIANVCGCTSERVDTHDEAVEAYRVLPGFDVDAPYLPGCGMDEYERAVFRPSIAPIEAVQRPMVHWTNQRAGELLGLLEIAAADGGSVDAAELADRIHAAEATLGDDTGVADRITTTRGATMVACGREPGYFNAKLAALAEVARWATSHGRQVHWG